MRELQIKRSWIRCLGVVAGLLLFALFFHWNLNQTITVHAFEKDRAYDGTYLPNTDIEGGYIEDSSAGITLYYQIYGPKENRQVSISGYIYAGQGRLKLELPGYIKHGAPNETQETYTVVGINGGVFKNFPYLNEVVFAPTYEWIGAEAFMNTPIVDRGVNLNEGLKEIRDRAFYGCSQLTEVAIGAGVTSIGTGVFANCTSLKAISVSAGNQKYCGEGGVLYSKDKTQLIQWPAALAVANSIDSN